MKEVFCNGESLVAPQGGDISCPVQSMIVQRGKPIINHIVNTGARKLMKVIKYLNKITKNNILSKIKDVGYNAKLPIQYQNMSIVIQ